MSELLTQAIQEAYATAKTPSAIIYTVELTHSSWVDDLLITNCGEDFNAFDENGIYKTWVNTAFSLSRTNKDEQGRVSTSIILDNTDLIIKSLVDQALSINEYPIMTFRVYLSTDITQPAEFPLVLRVESSTSTVNQIKLDCQNEDDINQQFPRPEYDYKASNFAGLVR